MATLTTDTIVAGFLADLETTFGANFASSDGYTFDCAGTDIDIVMDRCGVAACRRARWGAGCRALDPAW